MLMNLTLGRWPDEPNIHAHDKMKQSARRIGHDQVVLSLEKMKNVSLSISEWLQMDSSIHWSFCCTNQGFGQA